MKLPRHPPKLELLNVEFMTKMIRFSQAPEGAEFIQKANAEYFDWDSVRHRPIPQNLTPEEAWGAIRFSRMANQKPLTLKDPSGNPFVYWLPQRFQQVLHEVDQKASGSQLFDEQSYNFVSDSKDQIIISSLMEEAIATSQIEGAVTTRDQAKEMLRSKRKPRNKSEQMVLNSYQTIRMLRTVLGEPLSIDLLNRIQTEITVNTLDDGNEPGKFRTPNDKIVIVDEGDNQVVYTPPAADQLPQRMQQLVDFANTEHKDNNFIHPLIKASILHFMLAYEHPYPDGNGRTARALFYWYMLKSGYWLFEYLTISRAVYQSPIQYYRSFLFTEYDNNDLTYSLHYMLKVTHNSIEQLKQVLRKKQQESKNVAQTLRDFPGINHRQRELLSNAARHRDKIYTIAAHRESHGISYQTARTDLLDLAERKLLEQKMSGNRMVFLPSENLLQQLMGSKKTKGK